jgi:hypothetical protein
MPIDAKNIDSYGLDAMPWSRAHDQLAKGAESYFLGTSRPDGRPHAAIVGAMWHAGDFYFTSSPRSRKARNLAEHSACTLSARFDGIDIVLEGEATRVTEPATLETVAGLFRDHGWPAEVEGDAFTAPYNAPSAGPPPWQLYRFTFHTVFGAATAEPYGATRWRFER